MPTAVSRESRFTAATGLCWLLLAHLRESGFDVEAVIRRSGARMRDLLDGEVRIPLTQMQALWRAAEEATGDEALGIAVVARIDPSSTFSWPAPFSLHEHMGRASATLRDGTERQSRFMRLLRDGLDMSLEGPESRLIVRFEFALPDEPRSLIHFHLASSLLYSRRILDDKTAVPAEVWFKHPAPKNEKPFADFFLAPLRFDAECYGLVTDRAALEAPVPSANPMMLSIIESRAAKAVAALPAVDDFVAIVSERIEAELVGGNTNASAVAEKLGMSQRTLHRRLQSEGVSYQDLLDKVRCRLATRYLASRKHSINEVATLVGFSQPSAFHRAFKGWTGETPSEYQERFAIAGAPLVPSSPPPRR